MTSDKKGNKGIKRKSEESAEERANKHSRPADGASTSSEITHDDQAQGNVREINWMKNCATSDRKAYPQCTICNECHPLYIESSPFKDHCKKKHPDIDTEGNESDWIFRYFNFVKDEQHLKCKNCEETVEVLEFKGPFVKHFNDEAHKKIAEQRSQGDNEDAEEVKRRHTKKFVAYLYKEFLDKEIIEGNENKKKYEKSKEAEQRSQGVNENAEEAERHAINYLSFVHGIFVDKYAKEGNKNKKKYEKSEEGQRNARKISWMKNCNTDDSKANPQCTICNEYHPFYIESSPFKDHCKKKHPNIDTKGNESKWIFRYFDLVEDAQHLKCKNCEETVEVLEFKGPFVKHFNDEAHQVIAERRFQEGNKDEEIAERLSLTKKFIKYLATAFETKDNIEDVRDVRIIAWWMQHVGRVERNTVFCNVPGCENSTHPFPVYLNDPVIRNHVQYHYQVKFGENVDNWKYLLFDDYLLRCKRCNEVFSFIFNTGFREHLAGQHKIKAPWKERDGQSRQGFDNDDDTNKRINDLMLYLIERYKL